MTGRTLLLRRALLFAVFLFFALAPSPAHAALDEESVLRLPIERQLADGRTNRTPYLAVVRPFADRTIPPEVWVPAELLTDMKVPARLNDARDAFVVRVAHPADRLGIKALGALAPTALDLDFRALSDDMRQHFNMTGMEAVTGLSHAYASGGRTIPYPTAGGVLVVGMRALMAGRAAPAAQEKAKMPEQYAPFGLVWDHVTDLNPDLSAEEGIPALSVISPTWFALYDESGGLSCKGSASYVRAAHAKGYRVWALVSNGFKRVTTTKFLASRKSQDAFIARMLAYAKLYGFDGINVDFENVDNADAARLTAFVRRLSAAARTMGLAMSIDVMVPTKWSTCYERKALSEIVDYVAVMTYDEHWRTSPKAGSTASLPWVTSGLARTLTEIPASKLLLGIPLYTREWEEATVGKKVKVKSKTMAMVSVDLRLDETSADKRWLPETGQHYFDYVSDDKRYRIWVEDEHSIALRMALVKKHKLAGAAFWRKGFETPAIWDTVAPVLTP